jgi:hypothetical protein
MAHPLLSGIIAASIDKDTGAFVGGEYQVRVASGEVTADLTDFPLMIDLSGMPASFWTDVRSDGGNIRAYAADGVTMIPHDVTYINKARELGRMFTKTTLLTASNNDVIIKLLGPSEVALAVTDTNGRNAVWSDYEVVIVYPQTDNRTGNSFTRNAVSTAFSEWKRVDYYGGLTGTPEQGVAVDASGNLITIDTNGLRRATVASPTTVLASNLDPVGDMKTATGVTALNHTSDGCIIAGELWVPIQEYPFVGTYKEYLCVFNLTTLALDRYYNVSAQNRAVAGIAQDPDTGTIWGVDYTDGTSLMQWDTSGNYLGAVSLSTTVPLMNGITFVDGEILLSTNNNRITKVSKTGVVDVALDNEFVNPQGGDGEGLSYVPSTGKLYHMDGDGDLTVLEKVDALADFGRLHYQTSWERYPMSTVWSAGLTVHWVELTGDLQQAFFSMSNGTSSSQRATTAYRTSSNRLALWNSTDTWLESTYDPAYKDTFRVASQHNGTTQRRLFKDGALAATDNTISARPSGTGSNMEFTINGSDTAGNEQGEGYYQYAWARNDYVSEAWMKADGENNIAPSSFYTITEL